METKKPYNGEARKANKLPKNKATADGAALRLELELADFCVAEFRKVIGMAPKSKSAAVRWFVRHCAISRGLVES